MSRERMRIGVPAEVKDAEHRVAITPAGVRELALADHDVLVQSGAGRGSSLSDQEYARAGARIVEGAREAWGEADLVLKVKEPTPAEHAYLRPDLVLFSYLHLAADRSLTDALVSSGCTAVAFETVVGADDSLPLLAPMSEVAGRMAPLAGAHALETPQGGRGVLMSGVPGVFPAHVVVIGAGNAGRNAGFMAAGMGADVTVLDLDIDKLRVLDHVEARLTTLVSNRLNLEEQIARADLVIGAVLVPGARAPVVLTEEMVATMPAGAVLVDISIDQGGCAETSRMTTHHEPTYVKRGVVHYCVGNMPGAVPRTSTYGLANATLPYVMRIARQGLKAATREDAGLAQGINVMAGAVTNPGVADAHGLSHTPLNDVC